MNINHSSVDPLSLVNKSVSDVSSENKKLLSLALGNLESRSIKLYSDLESKGTNHDLLVNIRHITNEWKSLIQNPNISIDSDREKLRVFHQVDDIMNKVKCMVAEKQLAFLQETEGKVPQMTHSSIGQGFLNVAAKVADFSIDLLSTFFEGIPYDQESADFCEDQKDLFIEHTTNLLRGKQGENGGVEEATFKEILEGIEEWKKLTEDSKSIEEIHPEKIEESEGADEDDEEEFASSFDNVGETLVETLIACEQKVFSAVSFVETKAQETVESIRNKIIGASQSLQAPGLAAIRGVRYACLFTVDAVNRAAKKQYALLLEKKELYLTEQMENLCPEKILAERGNPTFNELLDKELAPLYFDVLKKHLTVNVRTNLLTIIEEKNLRRLGNVFLKATVNGLVALHHSENKTPEEILNAFREAEMQNSIGRPSRALSKKITSIEAFKQKVVKNVAGDLAFLVIKPEAQGESQSPTGNLFTKTPGWSWVEKKFTRLEDKVSTASRNLFKSIFSPISPFSSSPSSPLSESSQRTSPLSESTQSTSPFLDKSDLDTPSSGSDSFESLLEVGQTSVEIPFKVKVIRSLIERELEKDLFKVSEKIEAKAHDLLIAERTSKSSLKEMKSPLEASGIVEGMKRTYELVSKHLLDMVKDSFNVEELLNDIDGKTDILLYYILDKVTQEMKEILTSSEDMTPEIQQKTSSLEESIYNFQHAENPHFSEAIRPMGLLVLSGILFLDQQDDSSSLVNVSTPFFNTVLPQWQKWISGEI